MLKTKSNTFTFNEYYYKDRFNEKRQEFVNQLKTNPNDLVAKEKVIQKIEFIDAFVEGGYNDSWPVIWKKWEKNDFSLPDTRVIKNGQ